MTARRLDYWAIFFGLTLTVAASGVADAQLRGGRWILTPNTGGRTAVQVQPQPVVVVNQPSVIVTQPTVFLAPQPVAVFMVPAVLMSNGAIYANFGYGFEPIVRPCANAAVMTTNHFGTVIQQPSRPTYVHPAPNPVTSPYVRTGQNGVVVTSGTTYQNYQTVACFTYDASGRVFAYRF